MVESFKIGESTLRGDDLLKVKLLAGASRSHAWPARWPRGRYPGLTEYDLSPGASFITGAVVRLDSSNEVVEAGSLADGVLGISAEDSDEVLIAGKVLVAVASDSLSFAFEGERVPVASDVGQEYGFSKTTDGVWVVSPSSGAPRLEVVDVVIPRGLYICKVLTAYQQG